MPTCWHDLCWLRRGGRVGGRTFLGARIELQLSTDGLSQAATHARRDGELRLPWKASDGSSPCQNRRIRQHDNMVFSYRKDCGMSYKLEYIWLDGYTPSP